MGKQFFAFGALLLAEEEKLDLNKPLKEYLADGGATGKWSDKITARHVLSHSSGLMNWRWDKDQELTPASEPGTNFRHSGEGFYLLQRCVEPITGIGYEQWMQDRVMKPLEMKSSTPLVESGWRRANRGRSPRRRTVARHGICQETVRARCGKWKASGSMASRRDRGGDGEGQAGGNEALAKRHQPECRLQFTNDGRGLFSVSGTCCIAAKRGCFSRNSWADQHTHLTH